MRTIALTILMSFLAAAPARAVKEYDACIALIQEDPKRAEQEAGDWARFGGGPGARHCYALALIEIGAPLRAADELIATATEEVDLSNNARADLLVQAGELLVVTEYTVTAAAVAGQALQLTSGHPGALGLRAAVHLANGNLRPALRDLNQAIKLRPENVRFLLRRASAHRRLGNRIAARDDANFATELAPDRADVWLERGRIEATLDDKPSARDSLLRAVELDREGKIGRAAQLALQRMEAGIRE